MKTAPRLLHDLGLFDAVFSHVRHLDPAVREGTMFGCPAAFVGSHLAFCVYGSGIGIKLPADKAARLVERGDAFAFQPYGRSPMHEWVEVRITRERVADLAPVLIDAIDYARDTLHREPPRFPPQKDSDASASRLARGAPLRAKR
ncbi:hypothetical protein [Paraburkholderia rhizosphaerae]|uniref:DNA-binding protein (MmcQ/YjbR family) n=1 Tax=Paraburkholderia rhizosphaerae TaxID=480658 RepID=A0A4R8LH55_9BURK|nr:hypothetical protein [Paraburkholderia rhizosphaerae]TDY42506.1 hypothetical protein BX592_12177 [Paraburkholderia rhizosphaerae]